MNSRAISIQRSEELGQYNRDYEQARQRIARGGSDNCREQYRRQRRKLLELLGGTDRDWDDWNWQMKHRVETEELLNRVIPLSGEEKALIRTISEKYRWAVTPYYLALVDPDDPRDPIRLMSIPSGEELDESGLDDPMSEEFTNPAGVITRRYPDRLILNTTNACAMFCRHCQRRRRIGESDRSSEAALMAESVAFIRDHPEIRDVLITGGDPLTMSNEVLEELIGSIRAIEHVEIIRIGTRTPVTMPQRIDGGFVSMLRKYHPIFVNTQFNHPKELTPEAVAACARLADAGVPLGNQMVLLGGVNNDKHVVRLLNHELLKARVRPYYIFHAKQVSGTLHFKTSVDEGIEIMEHLRGFTSGMAIPTYIINAPGGLGKIPILPDYVVEKNEQTITLRTWEGKLVQYPNKQQVSV